MWKKIEENMEAPSGPWGGHIHKSAPEASWEDLQPPSTFLVSLDAPADGYTTDAASFFGNGGINHPSGLLDRLENGLSSTGPSSAHLLERNLHLQPKESRTICFLYGYLPEGFKVEELVKKYSVNPAETLPRSCAAWKGEGLRFSVPSEPWVDREISWHNYYLRSSMTYDSFFREHIISQGHVYQYVMGFQGAARDPLQHTMPYIFSDPEIVKGIIRYTLKEIQPDGSIPYSIVGSGVPKPSGEDPSDKKFLEERIIPYPHQEASPNDPTVREYLGRAYSHLVNVIGVGKHGLMRLARGDWNDGIVLSRVPKKYVEEVHEQGESVLNAAMASYVLDHYARMLNWIGDTEGAAEARIKAEGQRKAVQAVWTGQWFRRAWLGPNLDWIGDDLIWLEPLPWAIIGGAATPEQCKTLVASINELLRRPSPIGAMILNKGESTPAKPAGFLENGGIWPSINGTLIWALAMAGGTSAWDEWKKNTLAVHAEAYPDIWYGIWSGPDSYNSVQSKYPGRTQFGEPPRDGKKSPTDWGFNWTDFPVMNMHPHAWPLYSAAKLLGIDFQERGVKINPAIPLKEYEFSSPLLGFKKSAKGYSGWYAPAVAGRWRIEIHLSDQDMADLRQVKVNGSVEALQHGAKIIRLDGEGSHERPLRWELTD
jgi:cellobiose phosphorylase